MKKVMVIVSVLLIMCVGVVGVFALSPSKNSEKNPQCPQATVCVNERENYIDIDNDGVCDNYSGSCKNNYTDTDDDGVCDDYSDKICKSNRLRKGHGCGR